MEFCTASTVPGRVTEQELAQTVEVNRTPIRETLCRLHAEGLVHFEPNNGAVVAQFERPNDEEIFELRALLEPISARRAAKRASLTAISELRSLAGQQIVVSTRRRGGYLVRISELNDNFHRLVQTAAGSHRLV